MNFPGRLWLFHAPVLNARAVRIPLRLVQAGLGSRSYTTQVEQVPVLSQLRRVKELQERVAAENSKTRKELIIAEYPDLRDLLEL